MNIFEVVVRGDLDSLKKLVSEGADVEAENFFRHTLLMLASEYGQFEIVKYLIEECNANIEAGNGITSLSEAILYDHFAIAKYLIENGANYEELLEDLEKEGEIEKRDRLEKIILEVADARVKFISF